MSSYKYELVTAEGKNKKGTIEAENQEKAVAQLQMDGSFVIRVALASALEKDIDIHIGKAVSQRELSVFCRQFESILHSGVTVIDALDMLAGQTENKTFKTAIENTRDSVQKGESLAFAFEQQGKVFPDIMIHMIAAGEASGSLDVAFNRLGSQFEKDAHLKGMIAKSMVYPIILILVIIAVVIIMMTRVVPTFTSSFDEIGAELPGITVAVMNISDFMVHKGYIILLVIVGAWFLIREFKKTEHGAIFFGQLGLKAPLFGNLTLKSACATFTRTLSTLMAAGISLVDAVDIVEKIIKNEVIKQTLKKAEKQISEGVPLSRPLEESGVFPPMVYHMIKIGEETGNMEDMLDKIAEYYDEEVTMATESLLAAMEPLIIILMALIIIPIILAVLMPMFSMYSSIG